MLPRTTSASHFDIAALAATIRPVDASAAARVQAALDRKTKPVGSLGRIESLACQLAAARGELPQRLQKAIIVMAADHGVTDEGVSAYPRDVTAQMVANFARGGAAINVLARQAGAQLVVVNMGTATDTSHEDVRSHRIAPGTRNMCTGAAMTASEANAAVAVGVDVAHRLVGHGTNIIGLGEMGIGNTTAAAALTSALLALPPAQTVGRGTGVDDDGLARKVDVVERALDINGLRGEVDPFNALCGVGGLEIAGLAGVVLGAAQARVPIVLDGYITSAAALVAARVAPAVRGYLVASHLSVEPGHRHVLSALEQTPLLQLDLRLGEGTGAALAMGLADAAVRIVAEMATFDEAGVSGAG